LRGCKSSRACRTKPLRRTRPAEDKRLDADNPFGDILFAERIVDVLRRVADEAGKARRA
jgi:hypothetical protein